MDFIMRLLLISAISSLMFVYNIKPQGDISIEYKTIEEDPSYKSSYTRAYEALESENQLSTIEDNNEEKIEDHAYSMEFEELNLD